MDDLISRAAAIEAIKPLLYSGNCVSTLINMPAVDAITVEWLREKIKEHTDGEGCEDYLANSFGLCIEEWQKEQEAHNDRG